MLACSMDGSRSASLAVTPNHLVMDSIKTSPQCGDKFDCGDAGQKAVGGGFCCGEAEEAGDLNGWRTVLLRDDEDAFERVLRGDHGVFGFGVEADGACEFAVVDPVAEHELV